MTNFEKIKAMSVEEMASNSFAKSAICDYIQANHRSWCEKRNRCNNCIRNFLNSEVQEDEP